MDKKETKKVNGREKTWNKASPQIQGTKMAFEKLFEFSTDKIDFLHGKSNEVERNRCKGSVLSDSDKTAAKVWKCVYSKSNQLHKKGVEDIVAVIGEDEKFMGLVSRHIEEWERSKLPEKGGSSQCKMEFPPEEAHPRVEWVKSPGGLSKFTEGQRKTEALFRTAKALFRTAKALFRTAEALFRTAEALFRTAKALFRTAKALFRTAEALFRTAEALFRTAKAFDAGRPARAREEVETVRFGRTVRNLGRKPGGNGRPVEP